MTTPAVQLTDVTATHVGRDVLSDVTLDLPAGRLALVVGRTGAGKSTLLRLLNGLVPRAGEWVVHGDVRVHGEPVADRPLRELARTVAYVPASADRTFVARTVEAEVAFGLEQRAVPVAALRRRVEETLDLMGIEDLRDRACTTLSAGQQQRVAIAAALAVGSRLLVLDEPTSALDPVGADAVTAALGRLVHDLGLTVVVAEHRTDRIAASADVVWTVEDGRVRADVPRSALSRAPHAPAVARVAAVRGWGTTPLTVREARDLHAADPLRHVRPAGPRNQPGAPPPRRTTTTPARRTALHARGLVVRYEHRTALAGVDLDVEAGETVALIGRNGSGKSTLLWTLLGGRARARGTVAVQGRDPHRMRAADVRRLVGLVPHAVDVLLARDTVAAELLAADRAPGSHPGRAAHVLDTLVPGVDRGAHPHDLSQGERLALALAVQLAPDPPVLLLDEPSHGLDPAARDALVETLRSAARRDGRTVLVATHDLDLAAEVADRTVVLARGEVVADGPARTVLTGNPASAPQVTRVDPTWLRLSDAARSRS
ncbi:ABC transporter ATP-binding protein [Cellulomonas telluris]|uniref:ABC transporter ATP-binding protein n=1 Tax=Cellulomonas telluris TaxID=2306636 RepID=UPI001FE4DE98|nr:ABC transporter ATP-binding protein [Cellulomonas telluris]